LAFFGSGLAAADGLGEAGLGLGKVDDVPDGREVVGLDVLVLEVEGVLPDLCEGRQAGRQGPREGGWRVG